MNPKKINEEGLKAVFREATSDELDEMAMRATGETVSSPSISIALSSRKKFPIIKLCKDCMFACKKREALGLYNFECFQFRRPQKKA